MWRVKNISKLVSLVSYSIYFNKYSLLILFHIKVNIFLKISIFLSINIIYKEHIIFFILIIKQTQKRLVFNKHLDVISESDFLDTVTDNLSSLNPLKQIKTFGYGIALVMGVLLIMCLCFCIVWRRTIKRQ